MTRLLALIPARAGSKRIPGKNKRLLGTRPLVSWSIAAGLSHPAICDVLVSTDDPEIQSLALTAGVLAPWLRPAAISTDTASSESAARHALDWYEQKYGPIDGLLLLQPTSPFRTHESIAKAIDLFTQSNRSVVSVSPVRHAVYSSSECFFNGSLYLTTPESLRRTGTFRPSDFIPFVQTNPIEAIDIDTEEDWALAAAVARSWKTIEPKTVVSGSDLIGG